MMAAAPRMMLMLVAVLTATVALAQDFPTKPIKMVVPFPPGGPNDIIARTVGQRMSEILGQPVLIDNRGGAGGVIGTDAVAHAAPDGYTIAVTSAGALAISQSTVAKVPYEVARDFAPITLVATVPELLVVAGNVPVANMGELVALAKSKPGQLNFASSGPGSLPHLAGELLKISAGIDMVHVPYRGAAPAVNDLLAEQVQMVFLDLPILLPQIAAGKLKPIALGSERRSDTLKDVPTTAEAGFPGLIAENWYGMVAPAGTPPAIVGRLHAATVAALSDPEVKAKLASLGVTLVGNTPEVFAAYMRSETEKWAQVVKAAGIVPE